MPVELIGPRLATAVGDERWRHFEASLIAGGKSNLTYELTSAAGSLILRRQPDGALLPSAHDMSREARVQSALAQSPVPVARIVHVEPTSDLIGATFYVMEKVPGHIIRDELPPGYATSSQERVAMSHALVDCLADLHSIDPQAAGLDDFGRPDGYLERQIRRWSSQWEKSKTRELPAIDELRHRLARALPQQSGAAIVHGDFRLDNCLMHPDDPAVVNAVLDWELSTLGDPLTDLAMLLLYWRDPDEPPALTPSVTPLGGFPSKDELADRYALRTGADLSHLPFYRALAHFKFAVIAQGIASRVAAGAMGGQDFGDLEDQIVGNAERGLSCLP